MATDDSAVRPQRAEETTATTPSWSSAPPVPANPLQSPTCCRPRRPTCSPGSLPSAADVSRASRIHSGSLLFTRRHTGHDTSVMTMFCSGLPGGRVRDRSDRCWRGRSRRRSVVYAAATAHASARLDVLFARRGRCSFFSATPLLGRRLPASAWIFSTPLHRPPNGNGSAADARPLPPSPRSGQLGSAQAL